jgi:hypothetical protein
MKTYSSWIWFRFQAVNLYNNLFFVKSQDKDKPFYNTSQGLSIFF